MSILHSTALALTDSLATGAIRAVAAVVMTVLILRFLREVTFSDREEPARRLVMILRALAGLWSRHPPE